MYYTVKIFDKNYIIYSHIRITKKLNKVKHFKTHRKAQKDPNYFDIFIVSKNVNVHKYFVKN